MTEGLREKLVNAGRVLVSEDQGDYVAGHVTLRLPEDGGLFLMKPAGIGLEEMTPDNIITVDLEGERVGGSMPRHNEVFIHSEILRARRDIMAVQALRAGGETIVARMERSEIRDPRREVAPHCASLHAGYEPRPPGHSLRA
jgi:ribulose-5-phosphate 4-epimerase/fuculose-1-phosphate aldolase